MIAHQYRGARSFFSGAAAVLAVFVVVAGLLGAAATVAATELEVDVHDLGAKPLQDAVVYAEAVGRTQRPRTDTAHALIDQVNKEFVPLVTVLRAGTEVSFPNSDNIRHSIYSFSPAKTFTTKLYSGKQAAPEVFDQVGVVVLGCNIHDTMAAWVVIVDTPYFAKTLASGAAVLKGLEPGDYRVNVWYPGPKLEPVSTQIHIGGDATAHLDVQVDSAGSPLPALKMRAQATH